MKSAELEPNALYCYRKAAGRAGGLIECVRYMGDPPAGGKVGVAFESGERAGTEGEVTLAQMIAPWSDKEAIEAEEAGFSRMAEAEPEHLAGQLEAVAVMLGVSAGLPYGSEVHGGIVGPREAIAELAESVEIPMEELEAEPSFLLRDDQLALALTHAHRLAVTVAERQPVETLQWIEEWESGPNYSGWMREQLAPSFDLIRRWTGVRSGELKLAREGAQEQERLRHGLLEVREHLDILARETKRLSDRVDELLQE